MAIQAKTLIASSETSDAPLLQTEPSSGRIAHAIAAFPYSLSAAIMDIVDNAVENGAFGVWVVFETNGKTIERIVIADNGTGIDGKTVNEVLRAGSRTSHLYSATSLSRFGVGLKGAGFALATKITFLSRNGSGEIVRRSIDQSRIEATDRWEQEIRKPTPGECKFFEETLTALPGGGDSKTGTVVILEGIKVQTRDLSRLRADLVRSAGETYSKFLASTGGAIRRLAIKIDNVTVEPVDPLHRDNPETQLIYKREKIDFKDGTSAYFTAVSLPHPNTQPEEITRRYRYQQKTQGIYVYRNGRLVASGQTFDLFQKDFHLNALRAELEYAGAADPHFPVDVAKSTIRLDDEADGKLQPLVGDAQRTANALWRQKDVPTKVDIDELFNESNRLIGSRANLLIEAVNQKPGELRTRKSVIAPRKVQPGPNEVPTQKPQETTGPLAKDVPVPVVAPKARDTKSGYLRPADHLPDGVLYRSLIDGNVGGLVVEVNISHPFAKAVFEGSVGEADNAKRTVPRRATTAIQQLLYLLGYCEFTMADDEESARLFEQYRRYLSMNLSALLD